jgi:hypothetical protein
MGGWGGDDVLDKTNGVSGHMIKSSPYCQELDDRGQQTHMQTDAQVLSRCPAQPPLSGGAGGRAPGTQHASHKMCSKEEAITVVNKTQLHTVAVGWVQSQHPL